MDAADPLGSGRGQTAKSETFVTRIIGRARAVAVIAAALAAAAAAPLPFAAADTAAQAQAGRGQTVADFYAARGQQPLWLGRPGRQVDVLIEILGSAQIDGLDPRRYRIGEISKAVRAARGGNPRAVQKADLMLSQALTAYARDLQTGTKGRIIYVDPELRPTAFTARSILDSAAAAPSLEQWAARMGWMHPLYGEMRNALLIGRYSAAERARIMVNLERARELPAMRSRHAIVNAAAQRLTLYEGNQVVDSMRIVAGKPAQPTPNMAAFIRFTSLNPYWNVPPDLAQSIVAKNVVKNGLGYLRSKGYQVIGTSSGKVVDPKTVNWKAVAAGEQQIQVRQLPGPANSMGRMKFMFPNKEGIYLHDTPRGELFDEAARLLSAGCVRLQDAPRFARWLHGKTLKPQGARPEQKVMLVNPVPVYLMYMTAVPSGSRLAFFDDVYGWDRTRMAEARVAAASR